MKMRHYFGVVVAIILLTGVGCLHPQKVEGVRGYEGNVVKIAGGKSYRVGKLSADWQPIRGLKGAYTLYNHQYQTSISTQAFCGRSFEDLPLPTLMEQLTTAIEGFEVEKKDVVELGQRGGLRYLGRGKVDGLPLKFDLVVLKKDGCNFDFVMVSLPKHFSETRGVFKEFLAGFNYYYGEH